MTNFLQMCGIDVGQNNLDLYLTNDSATKTQTEQIANSLEKINSEFSQSKYDNTLFILEYTGTYSAKLIYQLNLLNRPFSVVSPYQSKSFMSALGMTNKNDKNAAYALNRMGKTFDLPLYKTKSESMQKRKQILKAFETLQKQERMMLNKIHALEQLPVLEEAVLKAYQEILGSIQAQLVPLDKQIKESIDDEAFEETKKYVSSVIGIGNKTAQAILLATNNFQDFDSAAKVAKFLGVTPYSQYSGTSVKKKGGITKFGDNTVRSLLFNCTRSAIRFNQPCKELFDRLRNDGKPYKVAAVAVMHKLIKQAYACATKKELFDNNHYLKYKKK